MPDLLTTKLYIPRRRHNSVARPRLTERLRTGMDRKLTLITAPAGFGKTTLLGEWIPQSERCVTWISLDEGDNDPARFWDYFIAALQKLNAEIGKNALVLLQSPQPPPSEAILTILLNEIAVFQDNFALVLDDFQVIQAQPIHTAIQFFLEHIPPHMHLIISSRTDPPLPLGRLRARNQLNEIRAADLRFTPDEVELFFNQSMRLNLSTENVISLEAHTEGWIAGLQMAALAIQGQNPQPDERIVSEFIQGFNGSHRYIVSYLVEEVLNQQPKGTLDFLLQTSILDRLSGRLCDHVLGISNAERNDHGRSVADAPIDPIDSQSVLEQLEHANLFVVPLDDEGKWYRYHQLFAEVLHARLQKHQPDKPRELHLRASEWYEQSGLIPEAMQHALEAKEWERAARLIEQKAILFGSKGQIHLILNWLEALPEPVLQSHPVLCIFHAGALMHTNRLEAAEARLREAEGNIRADTPADQARLILGRVSMLRSNLLRIKGDLRGCVELSQRALDLLPETEITARASAGMSLACRFLVSGDVHLDNERLVTSALEAVQAANNLYPRLRGTTLLARLYTLQGCLTRSREIYEETFSEQSRAVDLIIVPSYYFGLGDLKREWNQLDESQRLLAHGVIEAQSYLSDGESMLNGYQSLARLQQSRGDTQGARATLEEFTQLAQQYHFSDELLVSLRAVQAWLDLISGNIPAAAQWAETADIQIKDELSFPKEREYLTLVRLFIQMGRENHKSDRGQKALQLLERLRVAAQADGRMGSLIEILALQAIVIQAFGDLNQAGKLIEQAITLAAPEGYIRTFVDEGEPMRALLQANRVNLESLVGAYVGRLLAAFPQAHSNHQLSSNTQTSTRTYPLSERELGVLRLIAEGASNRDIAIHLVIAHATVKRHISNIFNKLGVGSRTQAVAAVRKMGLL